MSADEEGTLSSLQSHRTELIDPLLQEHDGRVANTAGDSLLLEFPSAVDAVRCFLAVQQGMADRNTGVPEDRCIVFRVGINVGDVIAEGDDLLGHGVNVAARLEGLSEPGGLTLTDDAYRQVRDRLDVAWRDGGEHEVKNIARPIRVWHWAPAEQQASAHTLTEGDALQLPDKPSIAVLPFENMSGEPDQEYFADGIAEDIITDLSKISGLFVIARNSSFAYKGKAQDVRHMCKELGVRYVLEGSVRKAGNRVRISAQLVDGASGGHLWAERYDRRLDDIFAVQDEVTGSIVGALQLTLSAGERQRVAQREPVNLDAYDCYLKARELLFRFTKEANADARSLFEQAFALDSSYGQALVGAASCHLFDMALVWSERPEESLERAKKLAEQALALDASLAEAHTVRGYVLLWQKAHDAALKSLERGINLDRNNAMAHAFYAMTLNYAGRPREGICEAELACRLDPQRHPIHALYYAFLGFGHLLNGGYGEAFDALKQSSTLIPELMPPHLFQAVVCAKLGRMDEARAEAAKAQALNPALTLSWIGKRLPLKNAEDLAMIVEAARKAGLPE